MKPDGTIEITTNDFDTAIDQWIRKWVDEMQKIYDNRTAGDYTFRGVVGEMFTEILPIIEYSILDEADGLIH